jgi:hypothetical protein
VNNTIVSIEQIEYCILFIRKQKIILDYHLTQLYGVSTKVLIQAVKRNIERFPKDFMFQLSQEEFEILRSQFVTSSWGGRRYPPYAFTEQGVAMLSSVLRSKQAIQANIKIMRTFVRIRKVLETDHKIRQKILELEEKYDKQFNAVFDAINQLIVVPEPKNKHPIDIGIDYWSRNS